MKDLRADFEAAMTDLVDTRHRFRLHVIAACCAEGMCAREDRAEIWGFPGSEHPPSFKRPVV